MAGDSRSCSSLGMPRFAHEDIDYLCRFKAVSGLMASGDALLSPCASALIPERRIASDRPPHLIDEQNLKWRCCRFDVETQAVECLGQSSDVESCHHYRHSSCLPWEATGGVAREFERDVIVA